MEATRRFHDYGILMLPESARGVHREIRFEVTLVHSGQWCHDLSDELTSLLFFHDHIKGHIRGPLGD